MCAITTSTGGNVSHKALYAACFELYFMAKACHDQFDKKYSYFVLPPGLIYNGEAIPADLTVAGLAIYQTTEGFIDPLTNFPRLILRIRPEKTPHIIIEYKMNVYIDILPNTTYKANNVNIGKVNSFHIGTESITVGTLGAGTNWSVYPAHPKQKEWFGKHPLNTEFPYDTPALKVKTAEEETCIVPDDFCDEEEAA